MIKKLLTHIFNNKPDESSDPKVNLAKELRAACNRHRGVNFQQIKVIAAVWFAVDIASPLYKLKHHNKYGQFFELENVSVKWGEQITDVEDLIFDFKDSAYQTGVMLTISVKELDEWMEPFIPAIQVV